MCFPDPLCGSILCPEIGLGALLAGTRILRNASKNDFMIIKTPFSRLNAPSPVAPVAFEIPRLIVEQL